MGTNRRFPNRMRRTETQKKKRITNSRKHRSPSQPRNIRKTATVSRTPAMSGPRLYRIRYTILESHTLIREHRKYPLNLPQAATIQGPQLRRPGVITLEVNPVEQRRLSQGEREAIQAPIHLQVEIPEEPQPLIRVVKEEEPLLLPLAERLAEPEPPHLWRIPERPVRQKHPNNPTPSPPPSAGTTHGSCLFCVPFLFVKEFSETPCYTEYHDYRSVKP
ncbi:hypothetical protein [Faecalibaculum rodentium]|nr:hypothetical protein [Faecalibaculum rodentium]